MAAHASTMSSSRELRWLLTTGLVLALGGLAVLDGPVAHAQALPTNTRQVPEGYWLGGRPESAAEVEALYGRGVRFVVSIHALPAESRAAVRERGMGHLNLWFGSRFPETEALLEALGAFRPEEVFIHCTYGADRTGALAAFLLAVRHGMPMEEGLLIFAYPQGANLNALQRLLRDEGYPVEAALVERRAGLFAGNLGGLKANEESYRQLIRGALRAAEGERARQAAAVAQSRLLQGFRLRWQQWQRALHLLRYSRVQR